MVAQWKLSNTQDPLWLLYSLPHLSQHLVHFLILLVLELFCGSLFDSIGFGIIVLCYYLCELSWLYQYSPHKTGYRKGQSDSLILVTKHLVAIAILLAWFGYLRENKTVHLFWIASKFIRGTTFPAILAKLGIWTFYFLHCPLDNLIELNLGAV